jgi:hypothetical protein
VQKVGGDGHGIWWSEPVDEEGQKKLEMELEVR